MADSPIAKKLQGMLNEEKWTRATLSGYTVSQIKELDTLFHEAAHEKVLPEIKTVCDEHLTHSKNSIAALYLSGIISLANQQIDDSNMVALIEIFSDNRKWNIVEYVCNRILDYGENRHALQFLADCYENEERIDDKYAIWERLIRVDQDEADIVKLIAEKKEKDGLLEEAIDYYRRALHRFVNKKLFSNAKEIWNKLIELAPSDIEFFLHMQNKVALGISTEKAINLLLDLYKHYRSEENWDVCIQLLKTIILHDEKSAQTRKDLVECYRAKYSSHSCVEEYIRISNISQSYRNIFEAIADFEKHISFDVGNFVYHRTWNIGRIKAIKGDDIVIDFAKKRDHHMALKMAVESLTTLDRNHIWVLKAIWSKDKLHDMVKKDPTWALKIVIKSFNNEADIKKVKAELVPSVLSENEWTAWSTKARSILKTDSNFGNSQQSVNTFIVRDRPLSYEEKIYNQFKAEKNFFSRISNLRDFLDKGDTDSEFLTEMLGFFTSYLKAFTQVNELVLSSYLVLKEVSIAHPQFKSLITTGFNELFDQCPDIITVFNNIRDQQIRTALLQHIRNFTSGWAELYVKLFPYTLNKSIIDVLLDAGEEDLVKNMIQNAVDNYRGNREVFIWVLRYLWDEPWVQAMNIPFDKILIILIHILDITYKEIDNHRETIENRRLSKQIENFMFKDEHLIKYLQEADIDNIERVYALLSDVKDLDDKFKILVRKTIQDKHPGFKFNDEEKSVVSHGLMVTQRMRDEKTKLLQYIMEEELPANQKEIAYALSLGDLRENAEYKAAKEKQDELNNKVGKLKSEIERAHIFDKANINTNKISFGTVVELLNNADNSTEVFTILGPWESDPTNKVISYLSPLGKRLLNHKVGEQLEFSIHDRSFNYTIKKITSSDLV